jgi:putative exosortase-associated protein (TIGR04073 family)
MLLSCVYAGPVYAADDQQVLNAGNDASLTPSSTKGPFYNQSEGELRMRKLARGVANVTLCAAEIPNQMFQQAHRTSPVTGMVVGAWKGLVKGGKRLVIGMWEVATFYHPANNHYQPYIEPEVVFQEYLH